MRIEKRRKIRPDFDGAIETWLAITGFPKDTTGKVVIPDKVKTDSKILLLKIFTSNSGEIYL